MKKWDKEIWVINILGAICLIAMFILFPTKSGEASQPIVREVEYHPYIHETINETVRQRELRELEPVVSQTTNYRLVATDEQKDLMARVVMSEASLLSFDGKCAVANTIVNRVLSDKFPSTIEEVIYQRYQYSLADNGDPDISCYDAVEAALTYEQYPLDMFYFRTGHYHSFAEDYCQIGNTYFSTERD